MMRISLIRIIGRPLLLNLFRESLPIRRAYSLVWRNCLGRLRWTRVVQGFSFCVLPVLARESKTKAANNDIVQKADELYSENKMEELYEFLNQYKESDDVEIRWRLARVCYKLGKYYTPDKKRAQDLVQEGLAHAEKAIELKSSHFAGYKWKGEILIESIDIKGSKNKLLLDIKECFKKSIDLNPEDPTCKHMLGKWCFLVSDTSSSSHWFSKSSASSTFEEALKHFLNAEEIKQGFSVTNWLFIGKCYLRLGNKAEAKKWLQIAAATVSDIADDKEANAEAIQLLSKLQ